MDPSARDLEGDGVNLLYWTGQLVLGLLLLVAFVALLLVGLSSPWSQRRKR